MNIIEKIRIIAEHRYYKLNGEKYFNDIIRDHTLEQRTIHGFINSIESLGDNWTVTKVDGFSLLRITFVAGRMMFIKDISTDWFDDLTNFLKK